MFVVTNLAKQLKLPNAMVETKKSKKGAEAPQQLCTVLEFLLGTISALLSLAQNNTDSPNQISSLAGRASLFFFPPHPRSFFLNSHFLYKVTRTRFAICWNCVSILWRDPIPFNARRVQENVWELFPHLRIWMLL